MRDARKKAGDAERRVRAFELLTEEERKEEPGSPEPADWEAVSRLSIAALAQSKDLWITAWLIEALTRLHGFAGLRDGIRLAHLLCDRFWDDVHPQPSKEEGLTPRFMQLGNLNGSDSDGTLVAAIMNVPITAPRTIRPCSCADYKRCRRAGAQRSKRSQPPGRTGRSDRRHVPAGDRRDQSGLLRESAGRPAAGQRGSRQLHDASRRENLRQGIASAFIAHTGDVG